ncbi:NAD(P)-binding domain-containing protein [Breoghania sp.]|uniref:NAD(P)-binding domain-containing protein n=1 Tax=Breoghania sp. TaxID=2065378 RepID=UPI00261B1EB5|nr:NAD(P)-binding domain-containing protein [Breoghania sp.]MDJ0931520.1 NAD(P)-binding domain-containing protein [Breoghania sp.]
MSDKSPLRTGVIGLGAMDFGMAKVLAAKGFAPLVFDISKISLERASAVGASPCASAADVIAVAEVIVLSLATARHVEVLSTRL